MQIQEIEFSKLLVELELQLDILLLWYRNSGLKYFQDRSLYFNAGSYDQKDSKSVLSEAKKVAFSKDGGTVTSTNSFSGTIDQNFTGITTAVTSTKNVNLATQFTNGVALPEINKGSGDIIYLDNRPRVQETQDKRRYQNSTGILKCHKKQT